MSLLGRESEKEKGEGSKKKVTNSEGNRSAIFTNYVLYRRGRDETEAVMWPCGFRVVRRDSGGGLEHFLAGNTKKVRK